MEEKRVLLYESYQELLLPRYPVQEVRGREKKVPSENESQIEMSKLQDFHPV